MAGILNLPPPTPRAPVVPPPAPQFQPKAADRLSLYTPRDITIDQIVAAQLQAAQGYLAPLAEVEELALTHPILRGVFEQRVSGLSQVPRDVVPGGDSPLAAQMADEFKADLSKGAAAFREFEREYMRQKLRGGGLIEPLWAYADGRWHIAEFVTVARQFVRFNRDTGEMGLAPSRWAWDGRPVSSYAPGTWVVCSPDKSMLDFGKRGELRSCINSWFAALNIGGTRLQYIERCGVPFLDIATDDPQERASALGLIENFGSSGGIAHRFTNSSVKFQDGARATGSSGSVHHEALDDYRREWSIALLGAEQTVSVSTGEGSQQSAAMHADIRLDKIQGDAQDLMADVDRYIAVQWAIRNYGPAAAAEAPHLVYQFMDEVDESRVIANIAAAEEVGIEVGEDDAYARLRWQKPASGTRTLRQAREEQRAAEPAESSNVVPIGGKR